MDALLPGLDYWLHEDDDGSPWLLVSEDFCIGNTIGDTLRLDFDATGMRGGWSPAFLNWDDGVRAETAAINTNGPDGMMVAAADRSPAELARVAADWFTGHRRRWPTSDREAGAARMVRRADERHSKPSELPIALMWANLRGNPVEGRYHDDGG